MDLLFFLFISFAACTVCRDLREAEDEGISGGMQEGLSWVCGWRSKDRRVGHLDDHSHCYSNKEKHLALLHTGREAKTVDTVMHTAFHPGIGRCSVDPLLNVREKMLLGVHSGSAKLLI